MSTSILNAIGNTPLIELQSLAPDSSGTVLVKLEYVNPTCSYKDRMALAMIEEAEKRGDLQPGMTVLEFTGGSTGSSLAFVCAVKKYNLRLISSDAFSVEKLKTMRAFGADVEIIDSRGGKITPDLIPRMRERALEIAQSDDVYFTNQFYNRDAITGYRNIGREIVQQTHGQLDAFCGGVGTGGMLMGVGQVLRAQVPGARVVALEPGTSAVIAGGEPGTHGVEGIGTGSIPPMLDDDIYDEARSIDENEARDIAGVLAREEGIFAGTSSALNVVAALKLASELGPDAIVCTVACDSGLKYLSGDLYA